MNVSMIFITKMKNKYLQIVDELKKKAEDHPKLRFAGQVLGFYLLLMILYLYFMLANLSSAPKFVYTQF